MMSDTKFVTLTSKSFGSENTLFNLAQQLSNNYCFCPEDFLPSVPSQCGNFEAYSPILSPGQDWKTEEFVKKNSNQLKLSPIKIGETSAFKAFSREKADTLSQTQCESPVEATRRKSLVWEKFTPNSGEVSTTESSVPSKLPKMFDDSLCPDHLGSGKEGRLVGFYTQRERRNKISHLRKRLLKHKQSCPVNKQYKGRSQAARSKVRVWGKFVKAELAEKYAVDDEVFHQRNKLIDQYVSEQDYQKAVEVLAEY